MQRTALWLLGTAFFAALTWLPPAFADTPEQAEQLTVAEVLRSNLAITETIRTKIATVNNPRAWLLESFLTVYRKDLARLEAGPDWQALQNAKIASTNVVSVSSFNRRTLQQLARIVVSYQFMSRLGIYLNLNSIIVEKDPKDVADALARIDLTLGALRTKLEMAWPEARLIRHAGYVHGAKQLADGIRDEYKSVVTLANPEATKTLHAAIAKVLAAVEAMSSITAQQNRDSIKALLATSEYALVKKALRNLDIPDSGDIDGDTEALGRVMRVQIGFELLDNVLDNNASWTEIAK